MASLFSCAEGPFSLFLKPDRQLSAGRHLIETRLLVSWLANSACVGGNFAFVNS